MNSVERVIRVVYNRLFKREEYSTALRQFSYEDSTLKALYEGADMRVIAEEVGRFFANSKAANFLEMRMFDPATMREYTMTVRPTDRPTPSEVAAEMRDALESIYELTTDTDARETARLTLTELGYLQDESEAAT